jgi:hypothetical protein
VAVVVAVFLPQVLLVVLVAAVGLVAGHMRLVLEHLDKVLLVAWL